MVSRPLIRALSGALPLGFPAATLAVDRLVADVSQFRAAVSAAPPGDEIVLATGMWRDADLVFTAAGEPDRPIVLRAQTLGKTLLTGTSRSRIGGGRLIVDGLRFKDADGKEDLIEFRSRDRR